MPVIAYGINLRMHVQGDPVEIGVERDGNADMCCLCNQGGSLLCCDRCPASYHMRCIGEQAKSLPEGEWACPECAVGGRGKSSVALLTSPHAFCLFRDTGAVVVSRLRCRQAVWQFA